MIDLVWAHLKLKTQLPHFSILGSVGAFIKSMEAFRKVRSIVDDNCVQGSSKEWLGSQQCNLLMSWVLQDSQWFFRQPIFSSSLEGGLRYSQLVTMHDNGASGLTGSDFYFCCSPEGQSAKVCMDHEIIMNWNDMLRKSHVIPREWGPITCF